MMARLVQDSEDEFPELDVVIKRHGNGSAPKPHHHYSISAQHNRKDEKDKRTRKLEENSDRSGKSPAQSSQKIRPRKRILKKSCDNPLLRPLTCGKQLKVSSSLLKDSEAKIHSTQKKRQHSSVEENISKLALAYISNGYDEMQGNDSSGLSSFIVRDSSYMYDSDSGDGSPVISQAQKTTRTLIRGRRPPKEDQRCSGHGSLARSTLSFNELDSAASKQDRRLPSTLSLEEVADLTHTTGEDQQLNVSSGPDEPFPMLSFSPPRLKSAQHVGPKLISETSTSTATKVHSGLTSPKKLFPIPATPHRPSMDAFWRQDVVDEWNDEYSPRKSPTIAPRQNPNRSNNEEVLASSPRKAKLTGKSRSMGENKKSFAMKKNEMAEKFLQEVDDKITNGKVSEMAASTGGIKVIWSRKLNTTAGRANWKRETIKPKGLADLSVTHRHYASIELAEKVIDNEDRLLNVLAHEFCHLANFMISGVKNNPHGKDFKIWAAKCSNHFGHRGIEVTTKHSYVIDYKYAWECINCGTEFKRHSKSIEPARHQCGLCKSKLVQTKPVPRGDGTLGEYQMFVKENMRKVKDENPRSPQKEIMGLVGKRYKEYKASKAITSDGQMSQVNVTVPEVVEIRDLSTSETAVDAVVRKLDFLDLTSP